MPRLVPERQPLKERLRAATVAAMAAKNPEPVKKAAPKRRKKKARPKVTKPSKRVTKPARKVDNKAPKADKAAPKVAKPKKRKRGRPAFRFDKDQIEELEKLAGLQCTRQEIAGWFRIAFNTLRLQLRTDKRAEAAWENGQQMGKVSLRRYQFTLAKKNAAMAIWLGKQMLGQKDISLHGHADVDGKDLNIKPQDQLLDRLKKHKLAVGEMVN